MDNNDILIRIRYALNIRNTEMVEIFKLGGLELTEEMVRKLLIKSKNPYRQNDKVDDQGATEDMEERITCKNSMLESFLNGLITYKRGKQDAKPESSEKPVLKNNENPNNMLLKKLKIALSLTSDDIINILAETGVNVTKGEISALLRSEGHKNYKECGDKYARNFLKGLTNKYRG
ncbi:hypothetical protein Desaci_0334 [Desulfosporosinus acidiphilus SJ4]|uniref:Cytoplasmic protein n=1 Tax=Desulfosporosinus acidiphilus (strain DSM 22704 / JCM 16185 / SJ4) TaxID=646529 RepID=I4D0T2_DESAJ|nr:DUF1456 family protein [Desulfosporosinus acidiphilus]AFM39406.1 hypothetical protein Desaci_0334 [Desulfosporosinus acidiphilus SJ4]